MALGIVFDGYILKILKVSKVPLTRNVIKKRLEKKFNTTFSWHTIDSRVDALRRENKVEEILSGKMKLYKFKG